MPSKKSTSAPLRPVTPTKTLPPPSSTSTSTPSSKLSSPPKKSSNNPLATTQSLWSTYTTTTPARTKLIDAFMGFLVVVGVLQFVYCVIAGNYPFNAFLAGFSATVGQFVLTASLRIQSNKANRAEFPAVSPERAFADYVFGSLILHLFCTNFIN